MTIIFDLGGVILDIDVNSAVTAFGRLGIANPERLLDRYHQTGFFLEVEEGKITADEFVQKLSVLAGRPLTFDEAKSGWMGFVTGMDLRKLDYIDDLRRRGHKVLVLSNTNPFIMSWAESTAFTPAGRPLSDYVDAMYLSYEVGLTKPSADIFNYLLRDAGVEPRECIFVDDGPANCRAAESLGIRTIQPLENADWRAELDAAMDEQQGTLS